MAFAKKALSLLFISALLYVAAGEISAAPAPSPAAAELGLDALLGRLDLDLPDPSEVTVEQREAIQKLLAAKMPAVAEKVNAFRDYMKARIENPQTSIETKECGSKCIDTFLEVKLDMERVARDSPNDLSKADEDINNIPAKTEPCKICYAEMGKKDPEVHMFFEWVAGIVQETSAAIEKITS